MITELTFNGEKLKEQRHLANKTQVEIATILGITPQSYGEMERGEISPSSTNLTKLCILFNCSAETFFDIPTKLLDKKIR